MTPDYPHHSLIGWLILPLCYAAAWCVLEAIDLCHFPLSLVRRDNEKPRMQRSRPTARKVATEKRQ